MTCLLDTSVVSLYTASRPAPSLAARVDEVLGSGDAAICSITVFEVERGLRKLELGGQNCRRKRAIFQRFAAAVGLVPVDDPQLSVWLQAADLHARAAVRKPAIVLSDADLLLVTVAMVHGMVFLTADAKLVANCESLGLGAHVELIELEDEQG